MNLLWLYSAVNHKHFEDLKIKVLTYYIMRSAPWRGAAVHGVGTKLSGQHLHPNVARHHTGTLWKAIIEKMCLSDMKLMLPPPSCLPDSCETERLRGQHQLWQRWALHGWAITGLQIDLWAENTSFGCLRGGRSVTSYISILLEKLSRLWRGNFEKQRSATDPWLQSRFRACAPRRCSRYEDFVAPLYLAGRRHETIFNKRAMLETTPTRRLKLQITQGEKRRKQNRKLTPTSTDIRLLRAQVME